MVLERLRYPHPSRLRRDTLSLGERGRELRSRGRELVAAPNGVEGRG